MKRYSTKFVIFSLIIFVTEVTVLNLGLWQQGRALEKQLLIEEINIALQQNPTDYQPNSNLREFQKITLTGKFDYDRTYYLENVTHNYKRGRKVITPFITSYGTEILISQGWISDKSNIISHIQPNSITGILRNFPKRDGWLKGPIKGMTENSLMFFASSGIPTDFKRENMWLEILESNHPEIQTFSSLMPRLTPARHHQYMFTWFTLFVILLAMYGYYVTIFWKKRT